MSKAKGQSRSTIQKIGFAVASLAVFLLVSYFFNRSRGTVAGFSFAAIAAVVFVKRDLLNRMWFDIIVAIFIALHCLITFWPNWSINVHPTILLAPIALIDTIIMIAMVDIFERLSSHH